MGERVGIKQGLIIGHTDNMLDIGKVHEPIISAEMVRLNNQVITIIIPAHNSAHRIGDVISNIQHQPLPESAYVRVIVCANACKDTTADVAREALLRLELSRTHDRDNEKVVNAYTHVIETDTPGEPQALNAMLNYVHELDQQLGNSTETIIGLNDDVFPSKYTLAALQLAMMDNPGLGAIGVPPRPLPMHKAKNLSPLNKLATAMAVSLSDGEPDINIIGRMYAFRPDVICRFPEELISEDLYLTETAYEKSSGFGILLDPDTVVYHRVPTNLVDLFNQIRMHFHGGEQYIQASPQIRKMWDEIKDKGYETTDHRHTIPLLTRKIANQFEKNSHRVIRRIFKYETTGSKRNRIKSAI